MLDTIATTAEVAVVYLIRKRASRKGEMGGKE
jgi:hypothetical protein